MKIQNNKIILSISNLICGLGILAYILIAIKILSQTNSNCLFINIMISILYLIPFALSIVFTIKSITSQNYNSRKIKTWKLLIIIAFIICSVIFIFYFIYGLKGIISQTEAIKGVTEGYIVSDIYSQKQLLTYYTNLLNRNIFTFILNIVLFANLIFSTTFLNKKLNYAASSTTL